MHVYTIQLTVYSEVVLAHWVCNCSTNSRTKDETKAHSCSHDSNTISLVTIIRYLTYYRFTDGKHTCVRGIDNMALLFTPIGRAGALHQYH
jgi:hypothetical protein